jgi:hypothetical protein
MDSDVEGLAASERSAVTHAGLLMLPFEVKDMIYKQVHSLSWTANSNVALDSRANDKHYSQRKWIYADCPSSAGRFNSMSSQSCGKS